MISLSTLKESALAFPDASESVHFGRTMFGVGKRNFASFDPRTGEFALRLPIADPLRQEAIESGIASPAPGKYGKEGWTVLDLESLAKPAFVRFLESAHALAAADSSDAGAKATAPRRRPRKA
ncbi:MAG TPA: hypothetical protein PKO15_08990 [Fibrobacteria bacterium]|nr:hypothetical protein [Fibrobacteria bacterium]HOX50900.1 hypothetical protein [Fibrobacteria bacterium]